MSAELEVLESLVENDPDLVLVGDASGTSLGKPCAWFCTSYDRRTKEIQQRSGGLSSGTSNVAELLPYVFALWEYHYKNFPRSLKVLIVSDSELVVKIGNGEYEAKANLCWWHALLWFRENGYEIAFKHVRRNTNLLSKKADKVAGEIRKLFQGVAQ